MEVLVWWNGTLKSTIKLKYYTQPINNIYKARLGNDVYNFRVIEAERIVNIKPSTNGLDGYIICVHYHCLNNCN